MKSIITLKTWQLFILLFLPFVLIYLAFFLPLDTDIFFLFTNILIMINGAIFSIWFKSLGIFMDKKNVVDNKPSLFFFISNILFAGIYMVINLTFQSLLGINILLRYPITILIHLYSMFAILYGLYFLSKSLVMIEKNRVVNFREYSKTLLLIWVYPVGIWFIHPRIQQVLNNR
jgi:hypothetical protein